MIHLRIDQIWSIMTQIDRQGDGSGRNGSLDEVDRSLLALLQEFGRMTLADLARRVGLSSPSVSERLRRLEELGVIRGYSAIVDPASVGYQLQAFVRMAPFASATTAAQLDKVLRRPEVLEAHHVVGDDCWIFKVIVRDTGHLEDLLLAFAEVGKTTTSVVLSSPIGHRPVVPLDPV